MTPTDKDQLTISFSRAEWREVAELLDVVAAEITDIFKYPAPMRSDMLTKRVRVYAKHASELAASIHGKLAA
jgi:hypothetical protein